MKNFNELMFSPLSRDWCMYYYILMIWGSIGFLASIVGVLSALTYALTTTGFNKISVVGAVSSLSILISSSLLYFVNRLMYSMCVGSLG